MHSQVLRLGGQGGTIYPGTPACPVLDRTGDHGVATLIRMNAIAHRDLACPDVRCDPKVKHLKVWNPQTRTQGSKVVRQLMGPSIDGGVTDREWAQRSTAGPLHGVAGFLAFR